ncbi:MAG TPA: hypothetical protein VN770_10015 [Gaiellaceae bacterium]|nr:hypothetical protein [Gaiellaceae bacterium]
MQTRLLPPGLALTAVLADAGGLHGLAFWLVLLALPAAAAAAFVGVSDALDGRGAWLDGGTALGALTLLVLGSAVREAAARGASVPALAVSAAVAALVLYALPGLAWLLEPLRPRPRARATVIRANS